MAGLHGRRSGLLVVCACLKSLSGDLRPVASALLSCFLSLHCHILSDINQASCKSCQYILDNRNSQRNIISPQRLVALLNTAYLSNLSRSRFLSCDNDTRLQELSSGSALNTSKFLDRKMTMRNTTCVLSAFLDSMFLRL